MRRAVLLGVFSLAVTAHAASLKQLLEAADQNNLDRRISIEQRQRAADEFRQAWTGFFPSVTAQSIWTNNQYPTEISIAPGAPNLVITPGNQLDGILRFELPLLDTTRWFRTAAVAAADDSAGFREQVTRDNVTRQVSTTYYSFAASLAVRESAKRSLGVAEAQLKLEQIRSSAGSATELEVLRATAELERNKQTVADTESLVANTRRALQTLTGVDVGSEAKLPDDNLSSDGSLEELESKAGDLPAVKAADKDAEAAGRLATASRMALVPLITAQFNERFTNATGFTGKVSAYTTGLGLVWRLDGPTFFNIQVQDSNHSVARLAAERQRLASRDQVHTDWQRLTAAIKKATAAQAQVQSAQRAAQVARDRYVAGATRQIDVIQAERDLFSAEVNQIQARTELASSHVALRISAGLPLGVD